MGPPHPPVERSTKFGTLPAAMLRLSAGPLIAAPSRNCALVQTEATVVISLTVTLAGGAPPSTVRKASAGLSPRALVDRRDAALGDEIKAHARSGRLIRVERKAAVIPVLACASCLGSPALPAHNVTVESATGPPPA